MLQSINNLQGRGIRATDGDIGSVKQFFFDDETWTIRYLVADTGGWLPGRHVLISPIALGDTDRAGEALNVSLTKQQIEDSPDIDTEKPVSRQHETDYSNYYGYAPYWHGGGLWGAGAHPAGMMVPPTVLGYPDRVGVATGYASSGATPAAARSEEQGDPNLRSTNEVVGYYIEATDGDIGHVEDFIIDDASWAIRYMVVDTVNWWPGKKVVVAPQWIERVSWGESKLYVDLTREKIKNAPEYDPTKVVDREYENRLYEHYDRPKYFDTNSESSGNRLVVK